MVANLDIQLTEILVRFASCDAPFNHVTLLKFQIVLQVKNGLLPVSRFLTR